MDLLFQIPTTSTSRTAQKVGFGIRSIVQLGGSFLLRHYQPVGYTFQEKSAKHCDLVPILHLPWTQFPFGSTDLVGAWLSLVEGEPGGDRGAGVGGGPHWSQRAGQAHAPWALRAGGSAPAVSKPEWRLQGAQRRAPPGPGHWRPVWPQASRDPGGRRQGPRPVPPAGRRGGPTQDSSPAARQGSVAARGSAGGSYGPVLSAPPWPAPPACCAWRSCCSGRWAGPAPAPR